MILYKGSLLLSFKKIMIAVQRFIVYRVFHADDTPHHLALGVGLGFFVASTPTIGIQMLLVLALAALLRANKVVGLPIVWLTNPFTIMPIYYVNYHIGRCLFKLFGAEPTRTFEQIRAALYQLNEAEKLFFEWHFWKNLAFAVIDISKELWVGSLVVGFITGLLSYGICYYSINWYRAHSPRGRRRKRILDYRKECKRLGCDSIEIEEKLLK